MTFLNKLSRVRKEAEKIILNALKKQKKIILVNYAPDNDEEMEKFYDMPYAFDVTKYGFYEEFSVISVEKINKQVVVHTIGKGENESQEDFSLEGLPVDSLCYLADIIQNPKLLKRYKQPQQN